MDKLTNGRGVEVGVVDAQVNAVDSRYCLN
jgi:hypothetical protein